MGALSGTIEEARTSSTGLVTDFHRNFTSMKDAEELKLDMLKQHSGQMRGAAVVDHVPFDPNDHDVQQYTWEG